MHNVNHGYPFKQLCPVDELEQHSYCVLLNIYKNGDNRIALHDVGVLFWCAEYKCNVGHQLKANASQKNMLQTNCYEAENTVGLVKCVA